MMKLTAEQQAELHDALATVLNAFVALIESNAVRTEAEFKDAIEKSLDVYGEFLDAPPVDPKIVEEAAKRMAKLASSRDK